MILALLAAAGVLAYLYLTGQLNRRLLTWAVLGALAFLALRHGISGRPLLGVGFAGLAAVLYMVAERARPRAARVDVAEACSLLGVPPDASPEEIRAAHRRLVAAAHPDRGGSHEATLRLNMARDLLLRRNAERSS